MKKNNFIRDGEIFAYADKSLFSQESILKCLYWYGDKFHTTISCDDIESIYEIRLKLQTPGNVKEEDLEYYLQKLERDLIDFRLRDIVNKETQNIRDLLIAKAFSNGEFDEVPPGEVSDPVGFNPFL